MPSRRTGMYGNKRQSSRYRGVVVSAAGRYHAQIFILKDRVFGGSWLTERKAALARDRLVLFYGLKRPLNFPKLSTKLGPASARDLREQAVKESKRAPGTKNTSRYVGVFFNADTDNWHARVGHPDRLIAGFSSERLAAMAHDRVAVYENPNARLNFPRRQVEAASLEEVQAWARQLSKKSRQTDSSYRGVHKKSDAWEAMLAVPKKGTVKFGPYCTVLAAAEARDRAIVYYGLPLRRMNFPEKSEKLNPASIEELRREAKQKSQGRGPAKFRGVSFFKSRGKWTAEFQHAGRRHHLGYFEDPIEAAKAYDAQAIKVLGIKKARLNFHPETGEMIYGTQVREG